jgi:hypothetical protein
MRARHYTQTSRSSGFWARAQATTSGSTFRLRPSDRATLAPSAPSTSSLKGTTQATARSADGRHISYPFARTTLNLWNNTGLPFLVAIADLIETRDPKVAKVYLLLTFDPLKREDRKKNADDHQGCTCLQAVNCTVRLDARFPAARARARPAGRSE